MTLYRMVPVRRLRRGARQSILRRQCFPEAIWLLDRLALHYGDSFKEALTYWRKAADGRPAAEPERKPRRGAADEGQAGEGSRRRRPRRRTRSRQHRQTDSEPAAAESPRPKKDMPSKWDDRYFFAALPSVPDIDAKEPAGQSDGSNNQPVEGEEQAARPQKRRRRRRSRGGRGRRPAGSVASDGEGTSGGD